MCIGQPLGVEMKQQMSVITLGVEDLERSRRFYVGGFGWAPVFENDTILFYQMNGFVLGTWLKRELEADTGLPASGSGAVAFAHNVLVREAVTPALAQLAAHGGTILKPAADTFYGGHAGYVADPDGHVWEVAWNPAWPISPEGYVTFKS